jgi:hypothetical protein
MEDEADRPPSVGLGVVELHARGCACERCQPEHTAQQPVHVLFVSRLAWEKAGRPRCIEDSKFLRERAPAQRRSVRSS